MIALTSQSSSAHVASLTEDQKRIERSQAKEIAWEAMGGKYGHAILTGNIDTFKETIRLELVNAVVVKDAASAAHPVWRWMRATFPKSARNITPYGNSITICGDEVDLFKQAFDYAK